MQTTAVKTALHSHHVLGLPGPWGASRLVVAEAKMIDERCAQKQGVSQAMVSKQIEREKYQVSP